MLRTVNSLGLRCIQGVKGCYGCDEEFIGESHVIWH